MNRTRGIVSTALCLALVAWSGMAGAFVRVGPQCQYKTIQQGIDAARNFEPIRIVAGTYRTSGLRIGNRNLELYGGYRDCTSDERFADPGTTTINASGTNKSALAIQGVAEVVVEGLTITGGSAARGGGIQFEGSGRLTLANSLISGNAATEGAGVNVSAASATTVIVARTLISGNTAGRQGAGMRIEGAARLYVYDGSSFAYNTVADRVPGGNGGGLAVVGPARADLASSGYVVPGSTVRYGVLAANVADFGGGMAVLGSGVVRFFSAMEGARARIEGNTARFQGGGIYLAEASGGVCGWTYSISGNAAPDGSAVFAAHGGVNLFRHEALDVCGPEPAAVLGAKECVLDGTICNRIENNWTQSEAGAAIAIGTNGYLNAERVQAMGNIGGTLLRASSTTKLANCLLADNVLQRSLVDIGGWQSLSMDGCTLAGNSATAAPLLALTGPLSLTNSIVWEASPTLIDYGTTNPPSAAIILRDDIVSQDAGTFPFVAGTLENVHVLDPQFESYWGPYQPGPGSPAIDYSANGQATDARGILRPVDLRERGDNRTFDVGAFERYLPVYADKKGTE